MKQIAIPCLFMRGGTSKGPYLKASDLPQDKERLATILASGLGAGHPVSIDGIGAGTAVTTKVAILSPSDDKEMDVDYLFAQVNPETGEVDFGPTCGNILAGIGPAAIEMGLVETTDPKTIVRIRATNTGAKVESVVETPGGFIEYEGDTLIDGVPGTGAPILLNFMDIVGSRTSGMFPTGKRIEKIEGMDVTLMDVAMPMCIARAIDFGITGYESSQVINNDKKLFEKIETVRLQAGERMGLGDVSKSVTPKFGLLAPPQRSGAIAARYFMPWHCHPSMAVTGSICIGSCLLTSGTVAEGLTKLQDDEPGKLQIEHPLGQIRISIDCVKRANGVDIKSAGVIRTARLLMRGELMVPASDWMPNS